MHRPPNLFDREWEWDRLVDFATDPRPTATLGVVSGRRRQGKTMLLQSLAEQAGGFFFEAVEGRPAEQLRLLGSALAEHLRLPAALDLPDWSGALDVLLDLAGERALPAVLDEFSYLVTASPSLPSLLQAALSPARRRRTPTRLIVCGSAISLMGRLLTANAHFAVEPGLSWSSTPSTTAPQRPSGGWRTSREWRSPCSPSSAGRPPTRGSSCARTCPPTGRTWNGG